MVKFLSPYDVSALDPFTDASSSAAGAAPNSLAPSGAGAGTGFYELPVHTLDELEAEALSSVCVLNSVFSTAL